MRMSLADVVSINLLWKNTSVSISKLNKEIAGDALIWFRDGWFPQGTKHIWSKRLIWTIGIVFNNKDSIIIYLFGTYPLVRHSASTAPTHCRTRLGLHEDTTLFYRSMPSTPKAIHSPAILREWINVWPIHCHFLINIATGHWPVGWR